LKELRNTKKSLTIICCILVDIWNRDHPIAKRERYGLLLHIKYECDFLWKSQHSNGRVIVKHTSVSVWTVNALVGQTYTIHKCRWVLIEFPITAVHILPSYFGCLWL
jgi:hypothetical protein